MMGMARADGTGFRYKPREIWTPEEFKLKREFENIGVALDSLARASSEQVSALADTVNSLAQGMRSGDMLVKINANDPAAGMLQAKLVIGTGINMTIIDVPGAGLAMKLSVSDEVLDQLMLVRIHDFNTALDVDGNPKKGEEEKLIESFAHDLPNDHYTFEVYRPYETRDKNTVDAWPDGTIRGRYQIRWKNVEEKKPYRFSLRFHQPEWGTIVLVGCRAVQRI